MAVFHAHTVPCSCGNTLTVELADSINVGRWPEARARILRGELHRATCSACARTLTLEKPFYYTDAQRRCLFRVSPHGERHRWKEISAELDRAAALEPADGVLQLRVVFGLDELREKLVAQDLGLDDRIVELLKVLLVHEHPFLLQRARLRLTLQGANGKDLEFLAAYEHAPQRFVLQLPRQIADHLLAETPVATTAIAGDAVAATSPGMGRVSAAPRVSGRAAEDWTRRARVCSVFALPDHWVNLWRWSPQPAALARLRGYAADLRVGKTVDLRSSRFEQMLRGLPRGAHLPGWAKQDLGLVFEHARSQGDDALQDRLFEIRFGFALEDDWSHNADQDDIDTLWKLLRDLPDTNVEGNTRIRELQLDEGRGGGWYDPSSETIAIGENLLGDPTSFANVVRHEVGHAVHEMHADLVDDWLAQRFGWQVFGSDDTSIDHWVGLMGGWGNLDANQCSDVRNALRQVLGATQAWKPGPAPVLPASHPWHRSGFGPRLAFERSPAFWFANYRNWYRANGKAFYLNYWYATLVAVDERTLELIGEMPDDYAAMSHYEFFAELYALHHDRANPRNEAIPADVAAWLRAQLSDEAAPAPQPTARAAPKDYETITRPAGGVPLRAVVPAPAA